jgi:hypothetical protein
MYLYQNRAMLKREFIHGIVSGLFASIAGIIYSHVYFFANEADFSKIINTYSIIGINIFMGIVIALFHSLIMKLITKNGELVFNITTSVISFSLIIIPLSISLPLNIQYPELFPGLVIPMIFFPCISWFTFAPLFADKKK